MFVLDINVRLVRPSLFVWCAGVCDRVFDINVRLIRPSLFVWCAGVCDRVYVTMVCLTLMFVSFVRLYLCDVLVFVTVCVCDCVFDINVRLVCPSVLIVWCAGFFDRVCLCDCVFDINVRPSVSVWCAGVCDRMCVYVTGVFDINVRLIRPSVFVWCAGVCDRVCVCDWCVCSYLECGRQ